MTRRYVVVYNNGQGHMSGYAPDLPGCSSIGRSMEELRENLHDEVLLRLRKIACSGRPIPEPTMGLDDVRGCGYAELMAVKLQVA
jgi:predicted RNase H-like HicB family nuclease